MTKVLQLEINGVENQAKGNVMEKQVLPEWLDNQHLERPQSLIAAVLEHFEPRQITLSTGFGMEGCALVEMVSQLEVQLEVVYMDTAFFFPETYALINEMKEHYPDLRFVNAGTHLTPQQQEERYGEKLWERDPDVCCLLRKVLPMKEVLKDSRVWLTGLRRDQSSHRKNLSKVEWEHSHELWKISPLADWTRSQIWEYIQEHDVPHNKLHKKGYPSIGCMQCTKHVPGASMSDYSREGRWAGLSKTECGLHVKNDEKVGG